MVLAAGAAALQMSRGAWFEAAGLAGLATGLLILRVWPTQRRLAWIAFAVTAAALAIVFFRMRTAS